MAAKANKILFEYLGHVQKPDGHTLELSGTRHDRTINDVYTWLTSQAQELGGFLVSQRIHVGESTNEQLRLAAPEKKKTEVPTPRIPAAFSDRNVFGVYTTPYKGATAITYKVTEE